MAVRKAEKLCKNGYGETIVMIVPVAKYDYPDNYNVSEGNFGEIVPDILMNYLMQSDNIKLIDRTTTAALYQEQTVQGGLAELDRNTAIEYGKITGACYAVKITFQRPDIVGIKNGISISGGDILEKITKGKVTFAELGVDQLAVVTNIIVRVVNLSTGIVEFRANAEGKATGNVNPKLNLGIINLTFNENTSGNFTQSLTGKAIDNAFKKIGEEINQFFNSNL